LDLFLLSRSLFDFFFLLLEELGWNASYILHGTEQEGPQLCHERTSVFGIEEASQINLHLLGVGVLTAHTGHGKTTNVAYSLSHHITHNKGFPKKSPQNKKMKHLTVMVHHRRLIIQSTCSLLMTLRRQQ